MKKFGAFLIIVAFGNASLAQEKEQMSPEGQATMKQFWTKQFEESRGKPNILDLRKKRTNEIRRALQVDEPDLHAIYKLIEDDQMLTYEEQALSKTTFQRMVKMLPPHDQVIFLRDLYREHSPPRIRVDPKP